MPKAILDFNWISKLYLCLNASLRTLSYLWLKSVPTTESDFSCGQLYCFVLISIINIALKLISAL